MDVDDLFAEALHLPTNAIAYHVSRNLPAHFPGRTIIETADCDFDVQEYAKAGNCSVELRSDVHHHVTLGWDGDERAITHDVRQAWLQVSWQGLPLDVVSMSWKSDWSTERHSWVLAASREEAERFFSAVCDWNNQIRDEVLVFADGYWQKDAELFEAIKGATFANLVLRGMLKQEILDDLTHFFAARPTYEEYGVPWKRGLLLVGPPGNGKTHTVKALINALGRPCLYVKSFKSEHSTDNHNIHQVFERAREAAPCVLVLEDLDSIVTDENRSFFLNELDGFAANAGVVTLATTNHPERLDPAIADRPSRFDRKYHFDLPGPAERLAYIDLWNASLRPQLRLATAAVTRVAELTEGFSFAYLKELFLSATMAWIATQPPDGLEPVLAEQAALLRDQMASLR